MDKQRRFRLSRRAIENLIVVLIGLTFTLVAYYFPTILKGGRNFASVLKPFLAGFAIAYLFNMPMRLLERTLLKKLRFRRALSILIVYVIGMSVFVCLLIVVIPQLVRSISTLAGNLPAYQQNLMSALDWLVNTFDINPEVVASLRVSYQEVMQAFFRWLRASLPQILNISIALGNGVVAMITAVIASIYMLTSKETFTRQIKKSLFAVCRPSRARNIIDISSRASLTFSKFFGGKLLDSAIVGVICYLGMLLIHPELALLIAVIIGVTNIIPFFGPFIGAIPSALLLLMVDPLHAVWFILFVLILQQFDGNILGPKILGDSTGVSPIWVLISIVVGGGLFGVMGMILGVPTFAVLSDLMGIYLNERLKKKGLDGEGNPIPQKAHEDETENAAPDGEQHHDETDANEGG